MELIVEKPGFPYSWYYMPATVHTILIHSTEVIKIAIIPIRQLSEEIQKILP